MVCRGVGKKGGQTQIVIGTDVINVKNEATKLGSFGEGTAASGKREFGSMPWWVR